MGVDSGALIKTLNSTCVNALQAAAGLCLSRTNPSVEVEHWLVKLIEAPNTDLTRIFQQMVSPTLDNGFHAQIAKPAGVKQGGAIT